MKKLYIAIEGIDRAGKSTVMEIVKDILPDALVTRQPGKIARSMMRGDVPPEALYHYCRADAWKNVKTVVQPGLKLGHVISDRSVVSGTIYNAPEVPTVEKELLPDLVILMTIHEDELIKRMEANPPEDVIEANSIKKHMEIQSMFFRRLKELGIRFLVLGQRDPEDLKEELEFRLPAVMKQIIGDTQDPMPLYGCKWK